MEESQEKVAEEEMTRMIKLCYAIPCKPMDLM